MNNRIATFIQAQDIPPAQLADDLGVQRSGISHILNGRNKPSLDFVQKFIKAYPEVNFEWLLFGEGPMLSVKGKNVPETVRQDDLVQESSFSEKPKPVMPDLFTTEGQPKMKQENVSGEPLEVILPKSTVNQPETAEFMLSEEHREKEPEKMQDDFSQKAYPKAPLTAPKVVRIFVMYEDGFFEELLPRS